MAALRYNRVVVQRPAATRLPNSLIDTAGGSLGKLKNTRIDNAIDGAAACTPADLPPVLAATGHIALGGVIDIGRGAAARPLMGDRYVLDHRHRC